jgi:hypothetical protein
MQHQLNGNHHSLHLLTRFLVPERISLEPPCEFAGTNLSRTKLYWLLDAITAALADYGEADLREQTGVFASLDSRVIRRMIWNYPLYIRFLTDRGIIAVNGSYVSRSMARCLGFTPRCKGYRFTDPYLSPLREVPVEEPVVSYRSLRRLHRRPQRGPHGEPHGEPHGTPLGTSVEKGWEEGRWLTTPQGPSMVASPCVRLEPTDNWTTQYTFADNPAFLGVDPAFREDLKWRLDCRRIKWEQHNSAVYALTNLKRDWYLVRSAKCGRVFTAVNGLRKTLRSYLTINGDPDLSIVDVSACQPYLLLKLIREHCSRDAYEEWYDLVFVHDLYMQVGFEFPGSPSRDKCKEIFLRILFCSNHSRFPKRAIFQDLLPEVSEMLRKLKKGNHAALAIALQQLESAVMIGRVCRTLELAQIPSFTIHDGLLVQSEQARSVQEMMADAFKAAVGEEPHLKTERCRTTDADWKAGSRAEDFGFTPYDPDFD